MSDFSCQPNQSNTRLTKNIKNTFSKRKQTETSFYKLHCNDYLAIRHVVSLTTMLWQLPKGQSKIYRHLILPHLAPTPVIDLRCYRTLPTFCVSVCINDVRRSSSNWWTTIIGYSHISLISHRLTHSCLQTHIWDT